jgi:hypothetical protein
MIVGKEVEFRFTVYQQYKDTGMKNVYYFFNLEITLRKNDDSNIYAYENVSPIPTHKLIEIFASDDVREIRKLYKEKLME